MPFGNRARINLEHGGWNLSKEHYETVTYWYGLPAPSLIKTDELNIGSTESEEYHAYDSPEASEVQKIVSRYDGLGIDTFPDDAWELTDQQRDEYNRYIGAEVFPAHKKIGRFTKGNTEFSIHLEPDNHGALLRRTLD